MSDRFIDFYGHEVPDQNGAALAAGLTGTTVAGTIVPVAAGSGSGSAVSAPNANDRAGSFTLTAAGTPAAGLVSKVFFAQPYAAVPRAVFATITNVTDTTSPVTISAANLRVDGFDLVSTVLVAAKAYLVQYRVEV